MLRTFNEESMRKISDMVRRDTRRQVNRAIQVMDRRQGALFYVGQTDGSGITARSGTTPGTGTVTLYEFDSGGLLSARQDEGGNDITVTAYNLSTTAVASTTYVMLAQEIVSGYLLAVWEDC